MEKINNVANSPTVVIFMVSPLLTNTHITQIKNIKIPLPTLCKWVSILL